MGRFNARGRGDGVDDKRNLVAATAVLNLYPEKRNAAARRGVFTQKISLNGDPFLISSSPSLQGAWLLSSWPVFSWPLSWAPSSLPSLLS